MFADPHNGNVYHIPLGLITAQGHTTLSCFGVQADTDLFGTVNDNTNSAVLAGKYILNHQGEGKCNMHITDLILKHATGLVIRTHKKSRLTPIHHSLQSTTNFMSSVIG